MILENLPRTPSVSFKVFLAAAMLPLLLAGCTAPAAPEAGDRVSASATARPAGHLLADQGLAGLDARAIVDKLDAIALDDRASDLMASIRPNELLLRDGEGREETLPMPADEFYVSFAPYVSRTHDCHFHSLTTCVGELQNAEVSVKITDDATGEVLVDDSLTTFDNGFVGLWLPRGIDATVTVEHDGKTASSPITTKGDDAATCVTTLHLA